MKFTINELMAETERREDSELGLALMNDRDVPCDGCTACCEDNLVILAPGEAKKYGMRYELSVNQEMVWALEQNRDKTCAYLVDGECSIYEDRPLICRKYTCIDHLHMEGVVCDAGTLSRDVRLAAFGLIYKGVKPDPDIIVLVEEVKKHGA